jgi:hypothetical protein
MRYVDLTPSEATRLIYRAVRDNTASLHTVDPQTRTVTLRKLDCGMVPRVDLARIGRVHADVIDSKGKGTSAREVMETAVGQWCVEVSL